MRLSIIIPAHNEADRLPAVLRDYAQLFTSRLGHDFEILVVANYCTDDTATQAREIAREYPQIRVIDEPDRVGKGGAIILGAKAATGDWIGFVDADGATPPAEFARLYEVSKRADGVIASRWLPGANVTASQKWLRQLSSRLFNFATRLLLGLKYKDTQCGAKIFKAEAWRKILPNIGITRFAFDVDILFQLKRQKYRILEEPTEWKDVAGSKVNILGSSLEMFLAILRMRLLYSPLSPLVTFYNRTIGKYVEFLLADPLFRHSAIVFSGMIVVHGFNMAFQMAVSRALPAQEYALLAAFLGGIAIMQNPLSAVAVGISHHCSLLTAANKFGDVRRLLSKWLLLVGIPAIILSISMLFFRNELAVFFHLDRPEPIVIAALSLPAFYLLAILNGGAQGLQRFGWGAVSGISGAIARFALGAGFVWFLHPASGWAMLGHGLGAYISMTLLLFGLFFPIRKVPRSGNPLPSMRLYILQCFFVLAAQAILMTADVVLVKHFVPENTEFAYAATLSRLVVFLPGAILIAMFPKVASAGKTFSSEKHRVFLHSLAYTAFCVVLSFTACALFPGLISRILFGMREIPTSLRHMILLMTAVMGINALVSVAIQYHLAQRRFKTLIPIILFSILYLLSSRVFHANATQIALAAGIFNVASLAAALLPVIFIRQRHGTSPIDETESE